MTGYATETFVSQAISSAISNIKDNTQEFPTFQDFPQPGEVGNVYIDLEEDVLYIWDSASNSYISQSWNQTIITSIQTQITSLQNSKLDKGGYTGTAQDLFDAIGLEAQNRAQQVYNLNENKQKKVTVIPITGNTTLSEMHNGAILHITNSCTLTFASNLGKDFNFVEKAIGSIIVQHVAASGVTLNSDSGLILKNGAMGSVYAPSNNNFILTGTYTTT